MMREQVSEQSAGSGSAREEKGLPLPVQSLKQLRESDHELRREEGSVFEAAAMSFSSLVQELEGTVAAHVLNSAREACKKYRAERLVMV